MITIQTEQDKIDALRRARITQEDYQQAIQMVGNVSKRVHLNLMDGFVTFDHGAAEEAKKVAAVFRTQTGEQFSAVPRYRQIEANDL